MSDATIIFFLSACIVVLICIVLYQQFAFRTGTQIKLKKISQKLEEIQTVVGRGYRFVGQEKRQR
jgi:mannose/fructose/N-acetylgalactosamine-specific phosphotransferase system component IID